MGRRVATLLSLAAVLVAGVAPVADAAPDRRRPCVREGEDRVARDGMVVIARKVTRTTRHGGYEARVFACWRPTRLRMSIGREADWPYEGGRDLGIHITERRYVGVRASWWSGDYVADDVRVYDVRRGRLVHRAAACFGSISGVAAGVWAAEFLPGGGVAYSCADLGAYLFRGPGAQRETLELDAFVDAIDTEIDASGALWLTWLVGTPSGWVTERLQLWAAAETTAGR